MPAGIVTNGVILRVLGGTMRKLKTCSRRSLPFRLFVILAGAFLLLPAFARGGNANCPACIRFYDMEAGGMPPVVGPYGVGQGSHPPAIEQGEVLPFRFDLQDNAGNPYPIANVSGEVGNPIGAI